MLLTFAAVLSVIVQPGASALRFVAANDLQALLGVSQGSVTPLAVLNDTAGQVKVILSQPAADAATLLLHPLSNEATIKMTPAQLQQFVKEAGNEIEVIDMDKEPVAASAKKAKQPKAKGRFGTRQRSFAQCHIVTLLRLRSSGGGAEQRCLDRHRYTEDGEDVWAMVSTSRQPQRDD